MSVAVERVVGLLDCAKQSGDNWSAKCPAHPDKHPSLSVSPRNNGDAGAVVHCHAGCSTDDIVTAIGLTVNDLFDERPTDTKPRIVTTYNYTDADGTLLYRVARYEPKDFRPQVIDGQGIWRNGYRGVARTLYRLPEVLAAVEADVEPVYIVEGEKDVNAIFDAGGVATTSPGGAKGWRHVAEVARRVFAGAAVVIVPDSDDPGLAYGREVARTLRGVAAAVVVMKPAKGFKDAADHLVGLTLSDLEPVAGTDAELDDWLNEQPEETTVDEIPETPPMAASFTPIDLGPVLDGDYTRPEPTILTRSDGQSLFYQGAINGLHGPSGEGKTFIALAAVAEELKRSHHVVMIDMEDNEVSIVSRLRMLGAPLDAIRTRLAYIRPTESFGLVAMLQLLDLVAERKPQLVVIDSLGEAFGIEGINEDSDAEVGPWLRAVPRRLAEAGPAVVIVDHATKANDNPLHPSGSKRKRAAVGGAMYSVTATNPLVAGKGGRVRLTCAKDRHGCYRRGETVATFTMETDAFGTRWQLWEPHPDDDNKKVPVELAIRAAVQAAAREGDELSLNALAAAMGSHFKGGTRLKREGIDLAVHRGLLVERAGSRNSRLFSLPTATELVG